MSGWTIHGEDSLDGGAVSANEYASTLVKACLGGGVGRGVAREIADGLLCLESGGFNSSQYLLSALNEHKGQARPADWSVTATAAEAEDIRVLVDGPSMLDFAVAGLSVSATVDHPILLYGLLLARERLTDRRIEVSHDGENWVDLGTFVEMADVNSVPMSIFLRAGQVSRRNVSSGSSRLSPSPEVWKALSEYAARILVADDVASIADAGAGSTDND